MVRGDGKIGNMIPLAPSVLLTSKHDYRTSHTAKSVLARHGKCYRYLYISIRPFKQSVAGCKLFGMRLEYPLCCHVSSLRGDRSECLSCGRDAGAEEMSIRM